jgi:hypothetical protein
VDKIVKELCTQFKKKEILNIAEELGLSKSVDSASSDVISNILDNLDGEGIPESDDCSDLMFEFLVAAEYIDEEGNILEEEEDEVEQKTEDIKEIQLPECFTFEDDRDPSCMKCRVKEECNTERINHRPECFGIAYSDKAEECIACLEASFCKAAVQSIQKERGK